MYGKIFDSIYKGTLYGQWEAIVTLQQLVVLCEPDGTIDMTPPAIAATTSIPLDIIRKGVEVLEQVDPYSRSPAEEGRRIVRLDPDRPWGWRIVNHALYRDLASREEKRRKDRERVAEKRLSPSVRQDATERDMSPEVANVAHTDADANTEAGSTQVPSGTCGDSAGRIPPCPHEKIIGLYHAILPENPRVRSWTPQRQGNLRQRWKQYPTLEEWREFFTRVSRAKFLTGRSPGRGDRPPFVASLDWLIKPENFAKVLEGKYDG